MVGLEHQLVVDCSDEGMEFALPWGHQGGACMKTLRYEDWRSQNEPPPFGFYRFDLCDSSPKEVRVRQALKNAIRMYETPSDFAIEDYKFGLGSYDQWLTALNKEVSDSHGQWWNCVAWCECRYFASEYFREWPLGPTNQTEELAKLFKSVSDLFRDASEHKLSNPRKTKLTKEAYEAEKLIPSLLREVASEFA